ncbi:hypothetical protein TUSST3_45890 [Streptomyces sp. TUS-ST3]|nr:hypothetical protein [Streptomyces sp. TUS-ST3]GLP67967.1 hypothetical protein TUSST3_45890 [Streptomyces sp. TUS-ST3]
MAFFNEIGEDGYETRKGQEYRDERLLCTDGADETAKIGLSAIFVCLSHALPAADACTVAPESADAVSPVELTVGAPDRLDVLRLNFLLDLGQRSLGASATAHQGTTSGRRRNRLLTSARSGVLFGHVGDGTRVLHG